MLRSFITTLLFEAHRAVGNVLGDRSGPASYWGPVWRPSDLQGLWRTGNMGAIGNGDEDYVFSVQSILKGVGDF